MADESLVLILGIPAVLLTLFCIWINNKPLAFFVILMSIFVLSALGYTLDAGLPQQAIWGVILILSLIAIPAYLIIIIVITIKNFFSNFRRN